MINLLFNIISISDLNFVCFKYLKMKGGVEEVFYGCLRGLYERIPECKLAMHVNCMDEIQNSTIHDVGSNHNGGSNRLDRLKSCCHHSLRHLCFTQMVHGES